MLKLVSYVPPAILGAMVLGPKVVAAQAGSTENCGGGTVIVVSAAGQACCPCVPSSNKYNPDSCNLNRCQLGNCAACRLLVFNNQNTCQKTTVHCPSCTCTPVQVADKKKPFWMCR
jgi:hypothetical protein